MLNQSSDRTLSLTVMAFSLILLTAGCSTMQGTNTPVGVTVPSADVITRHQQAVKLMQQQQWQAAADILEAITMQQPALSGPWLNLGIARTKKGNSQEAEAAFKHAIDANTANVEAYNQLGVLYRRTGRPAEAGFLYETALQLEPDNTSLHWNLAILHDTDLPDPRKALFHYQRYRQITGSDNPQLLSWIDALSKQTQTDSLAARVNP